MASFSSPGLSDTTSRVRMAARRRARREQERQAKIWESLQSKRRGHRAGAGRQVVNEILKERRLLRQARDAADTTLRKHRIRHAAKFADENARNQSTTATATTAAGWAGHTSSAR